MGLVVMDSKYSIVEYKSLPWRGSKNRVTESSASGCVAYEDYIFYVEI